MPTYELSLVMRHALARPQLVDAIKRSAVEIMGRGGYIRQLQYLGDRVLPQKGSRGKGKGQTRGHYFMLQVDLPSKGIIRKAFTIEILGLLPVHCYVRRCISHIFL